MSFLTQVGNTTCRCKVTDYVPAELNDTPHPTEAWVQLELFDYRGIRDLVLEDSVTPEDRLRIAAEFEASRLADKYDIAF